MWILRSRASNAQGTSSRIKVGSVHPLSLGPAGHSGESDMGSSAPWDPAPSRGPSQQVSLWETVAESQSMKGDTRHLLQIPHSNPRCGISIRAWEHACPPAVPSLGSQGLPWKPAGELMAAPGRYRPCIPQSPERRLPPSPALTPWDRLPSTGPLLQRQLASLPHVKWGCRDGNQ